MNRGSPSAYLRCLLPVVPTPGCLNFADAYFRRCLAESSLFFFLRLWLGNALTPFPWLIVQDLAKRLQPIYI